MKLQGFGIARFPSQANRSGKFITHFAGGMGVGSEGDGNPALAGEAENERGGVGLRDVATPAGGVDLQGHAGFCDAVENGLDHVLHHVVTQAMAEFFRQIEVG